MNSELVLFINSKFILLITTIEEIVELSDAELGYQGIKTQDRRELQTHKLHRHHDFSSYGFDTEAIYTDVDYIKNALGLK